MTGRAVARPHRAAPRARLLEHLANALTARDAQAAAACIHELWMRGEIGLNIDRALEQLWAVAGGRVPEWLPMRHVEWLPVAYAVAARCRARRRGRSNIYLVLLDFRDRGEPYGVYVGMTDYAPAERFDQHKAGIRAAGSVLKRGLEVLAGPVQHLQGIARTEAERIEAELAEALRAAGITVRGGH